MGEVELSDKNRPSSLALTHVTTSQRTTVREEGLRFDSVCVDVSHKRILWDVSGHASPGRVLAVMGPSGSGKTTLLNTLAAQLPLSSGFVTLHGRRITKKIKRKISYVLQADIFFPNLTLRETLRYSALLRLSSDLTFRERLNKVEEVIKLLRLQDCASTIIGNVLVRGLSGGEKKRANIACELLTNPTLLLLDEPTSGLDSSGALSLLQTLKSLAEGHNKTVVTSIHQPSSQMYHMFDGLLLLAKGKVAYYGPAADALPYFASLGLHCTLHYNPADYMLELVTDDNSRKVLIGDDPQQEDRPRPPPWWKSWTQYLPGQRDKKTPPDSEVAMPPDPEVASPPDLELVEYVQSPRLPRRTADAINPMAVLTPEGVQSVPPLPETLSRAEKTQRERKWPTPWYWQFLVLIVRTFRQSRHIILSKLNLLQALAITAVVSILWFQIPHEEQSIQDRYGLLFFSSVFWGFTPLILAIAAFSIERVVISKERASGSYHLSAYYLAKTISEVPLILAMPSIFIIIVYWAAGLNGPAAFFGTWFVLILNAFVAQSFGLLIGATVMDFQRGLVGAVVFMLSMMLLGGFYVQRVPSWLKWAQSLSFIAYTFDAMLQLEFTEDTHFTCDTQASEYPVCNVTTVTNTTATLSGTDVLDDLNVTIPFYINIIILISMAIGIRILAYLSLRLLHRR